MKDGAGGREGLIVGFYLLSVFLIYPRTGKQAALDAILRLQHKTVWNQ